MLQHCLQPFTAHVTATLQFHLKGASISSSCDGTCTHSRARARAGARSLLTTTQSELYISSPSSTCRRKRVSNIDFFFLD